MFADPAEKLFVTPKLLKAASPPIKVAPFKFNIPRFIEGIVPFPVISRTVFKPASRILKVKFLVVPRAEENLADWIYIPSVEFIEDPTAMSIISVEL